MQRQFFSTAFLICGALIMLYGLSGVSVQGRVMARVSAQPSPTSAPRVFARLAAQPSPRPTLTPVPSTAPAPTGTPAPTAPPRRSEPEEPAITPTSPPVIRVDISPIDENQSPTAEPATPEPTMTPVPEPTASSTPVPQPSASSNPAPQPSASSAPQPSSPGNPQASQPAASAPVQSAPAQPRPSTPSVSAPSVSAAGGSQPEQAVTLPNTGTDVASMWFWTVFGAGLMGVGGFLRVTARKIS